MSMKAKVGDTIYVVESGGSAVIEMTVTKSGRKYITAGQFKFHLESGLLVTSYGLKSKAFVHKAEAEYTVYRSKLTRAVQRIGVSNSLAHILSCDALTTILREHEAYKGQG